MAIGMIGLGRMGNHMRSRLRSKDIETIGYDIDPEVSDVSSIAELCDGLGNGPRIILSLIHISEPTRRLMASRMPSSA